MDKPHFHNIISLNEAPEGRRLKIVDLVGGHGVRRRLLSLGFHKNDMIEIAKKSVFGGPVLVKDLTSDTSVALGKRIAKKILVEIIG